MCAVYVCKPSSFIVKLRISDKKAITIYTPHVAHDLDHLAPDQVNLWISLTVVVLIQYTNQAKDCICAIIVLVVLIFSLLYTLLGSKCFHQILFGSSYFGD